jgi:hypothetical protein
MFTAIARYTALFITILLSLDFTWMHVWTYPIMQEKNNIYSKKANAVMYPAYS